MKKLFVMAAALVLAAAPAAAQESPSGAEPAVQAAAVQEQAPREQAAAPTIHVSRAEIQQRVAALEAERNGEQIGSSSFWTMVAAIALGVVIAMLLLD